MWLYGARGDQVGPFDLMVFKMQIPVTDGLEGKGQEAAVRVLLVDDNADSNEMLGLLLQDCGFQVVTALSGAEALEKAASSQPHVVVLDLGLPDIDGFAVLQRLKQLDALHGTRFVALSGRSMPEDIRRMREVGFHHQMVKPPDFEKLIQIIASAAPAA